MKYGKWIADSIFVICTFIFWRVRYPYALTYQEQFQLFLWDDDYFWGRVAEPGGVARWVAECLVQCYNNVTAGAIILTIIFLMIQQLTWKLMKKESPLSYDSTSKGNKSEGLSFFYALSFIPVFALWFQMGDENTMLTFPVSLLFAMLAMWHYTYMQFGTWQRYIYFILMACLLYWMAGPVVLMFAVWTAVWPLDTKWKHSIGTSTLILLIHVIICCIIIWASARVLPYTSARLFRGIDYYRYPLLIPYLMMAIELLCVVIPLFPLRELQTIAHPQEKGKSTQLGIVKALGLTVFIFVCAFLIIPKGFKAKTYELIEYDYLVRTQQWQKIIAKAEKQNPDLPMSVCATNLALGKTNQLGERAFHFFQNGGEGLIPHFERSFVSPLITSEAYFHLGLVNSAQRLTFECMEAIPNYNKSVRAVKRLVETNLINGQYEVARKYINLLKKTTFYSHWAMQAEQLLCKEQAINQHPLYGELRRSHLQEDFLFSEQELDKIMGQLFLQNPNNHLAKQYLMLYPLLEKDIPKFMQYMGVIQQKEAYMPTIAQQGVAIAYMQQRQQPPQGLLNDIILSQCNDFSQTLSQGGKDSPLLNRFKGTLWYYLVK